MCNQTLTLLSAAEMNKLILQIQRNGLQATTNNK